MKPKQDTNYEADKLVRDIRRASGSIPVRPTIFFNDLRHSRLDPVRGKVCFKSVSGNRAAAFSCISLAGVECFDLTGDTNF